MVPCLEVPGSQEIAVDGLGCLGCDSVLSCRVVGLLLFHVDRVRGRF
jgi:hypothetical protein